MTDRRKTVTSLITLVVLGLTMTCDVQADSAREQARTLNYLQPCIAEIGKHVDYADSTRVVHWVERLNQKNLVELEVLINTAVFGAGRDGAAREYQTLCITGSLGDVVKFRIDDSGSESDAQG